MAIKKVCVIGSGTMGNGITQVVAQGGYETTMVDV
jgi:3-hydroxyacyl-CoA dehydrogenase